MNEEPRKALSKTKRQYSVLSFEVWNPHTCREGIAMGQTILYFPNKSHFNLNYCLWNLYVHFVILIFKAAECLLVAFVTFMQNKSAFCLQLKLYNTWLIKYLIINEGHLRVSIQLCPEKCMIAGKGIFCFDSGTLQAFHKNYFVNKSLHHVLLKHSMPPFSINTDCIGITFNLHISHW